MSTDHSFEPLLAVRGDHQEQREKRDWNQHKCEIGEGELRRMLAARDFDRTGGRGGRFNFFRMLKVVREATG